MVYADSVWLGPASKETFVLSREHKVLRLVPPDVDAWSIKPIIISLVRLKTEDTLSVQMNFPYYYQVESMPFGADVFLKSAVDSLALGKTPLTYASKTPLTGQIVVEHPGFETYEKVAGRQLWNRTVVALKPVSPHLLNLNTPELNWRPPPKRHKWIDYASLGTALAAGALAIHFKTKADHRFDQYKKTGDPSFRHVVNRFDTLSGISLGVSQAGLGLFALRLILR